MVFLCLLPGYRLLAERNAIAWNFINLPATAVAGETLKFSAVVTNNGEAPWQENHYLELRDQRDVHLSYGALAGTAVGVTKTAFFTLPLPVTPGTYAYSFSAVEHGREYFGPTLSRTIVVRSPPLEVSLALDTTRLVVGQRIAVRSVAGREGEVAAHGLEARPLGGEWETWADWFDAGEVRDAFESPRDAGIYEVRAFAARASDDDFSYSNRLVLTVSEVAPGIVSPPSSAIVTVGESVKLVVSAVGTTPAYQWQKDGRSIAGATDTSLTIAPTHVNDSGAYTVTVSNSAGAATSRPAAVLVNAHALGLTVAVSHFPAAGGRQTTPLNAAHVGDVINLVSTTTLVAGTAWRHNVLVRRPAITEATAFAPEDGSGLSGNGEAWNKDGWGSPHTDGNSYDARVTGHAAIDLGNREPFMHALASGQAGSTRTIDFVLDAPGTWLVRAEVLDGTGELIAAARTTTVTVSSPALAADPANITYPYGRTDRFVGVFWNAGQAHRLWSTWRADYERAYRDTWAVNWKLMWQPSPYFKSGDGSSLRLDPAAESPWTPFWSAHQVYALVPDTSANAKLSHDLTSQAFAEKAALRLMDMGVDFVAVDYTNQFLEEREDVFPAVNNLALAFQAVAARSQSGERIRMTAVVPANVDSGDWAGNGGFGPVALARFTAKLTTLYARFARFESAWFYLEDDGGVRKPLLLLWVGAGGEAEADGSLARAKLAQLKLADGRALADVFTIRWVGAFLPDNARFLSGATYRVPAVGGTVVGQVAKPKLWSYTETFPFAATLAPGASGPTPAIEAITVQPVATGEDRFGRAWTQTWPPGQGFHYETPADADPIPLGNYGRTWRAALTTARALNPKFLLTTWAEFGSENDESRPELSVTIMDNNKFGTHFGDALKDAVRQFKYRAPTAWIDTVAVGAAVQWFSETSVSAQPSFRVDQTIRLQGWVTPNVATTFADGSVKVFVDDQLRGVATVGGAWNGATHWFIDLPLGAVGVGRHNFTVLADDGIGGTALAGVQFRGEPPASVLALTVVNAGTGGAP